MTNEEEILKELKEIKLCLLGDKMKKIPGVMDIIERHTEELYGNDATKDIGLKVRQEDNVERIEVLENDRKKIYWTCGGISMTIGVIWLIFEHLYKP